jgi:hypothetical protein
MDQPPTDQFLYYHNALQNVSRILNIHGRTPSQLAHYTCRGNENELNDPHHSASHWLAFDWGS